MHVFHPGAFVAARRAKGEVVPVGLAYADPGAHYVDESIGAHGRRVVGAEKTRVAVAIGDTIEAREIKIEQLRDRTRDEVQRLVHVARASLTADATR